MDGFPWGVLMDGSTLGAVETATLTQGVAFLYAQAGELLRRRRGVRDRAAVIPKEPGGEVPAPGPESFLALQLPEDVFEPAGAGPISPVPAALDRLADSLLQARRDVDDYVVGMAVLDRDSQVALQAVDRLRRLVEEVYDTSVTFRGEQERPAGAETRVNAQQIGVVLSGNVKVRGDIAGHTINKNA
jgi:hypothetical protein